MASSIIKIFTAEEAWSGGYYELAIELGPRSDERLEVALEALWNSPDLQGCYRDNDREAVEQTPVELGLWNTENNWRLYGVARLPDGAQVACMSAVIRIDEGSDWILLGLPMGALGTVYDVGAYPFNDGKDSRGWCEPLNEWLVSIARSIFAKVPFTLALVGHEVSGEDDALRIAALGLPQQRWYGYLWREDSELVWYPPNIYEAPISF